MSYDLSFSKSNKENFAQEEIDALRKEIRIGFPKAEFSKSEINFEYCQVSFFEDSVFVSIPFWKENLAREGMINSLLQVLFKQHLHCEDSQVEKVYESYSPSIFKNFSTIAMSVLGVTIDPKFPCGHIRFSVVGAKAITEIINNHQEVLSPETEQQLVRDGDYKSLFHYNLRFAYSVAKRFWFHWINAEELIDASIDGFEKGLTKFMENDYDFKVVEYIVWWSQQSCIEYLLRQVWTITAHEGYKHYSSEEIASLLDRWKGGEKKVINEAMTNHSFLFKQLEETYQLELSETARKEAVINTLNQKSSITTLEQEEYQTYKSELEFEDFLFLESAILLEQVKAS